MLEATKGFPGHSSWPGLMPQVRRYGFLGLTTAALAGLAALLVLELSASWQREQAAAERNIRNMARVLEQHTLSTIGKIDNVLAAVVAEHGPCLAGDDVCRKDVNRELGRYLAYIPESQSLRAGNAEGRFIYDASGTVSAATMADRAYFRRNRDDPDAGLVISEPIFARITNNWVITVSRRFNHRDGRFAGLVQAAVRADYFQGFYQTLDTGSGGVVALLDTEMRMVARHPVIPEVLGKTLRQPLLEQPLRSGAVESVYTGVSTLDGQKRLWALRRVAGLPFVVLVGMSHDTLFAEWRRTAWIYSLGGAGLGFALLGLAWRWQRRYEEVEDLATRMSETSAALEATNRELETFAYSVSHDLRAPLRAIDGFSLILLEDHAERLDDEGRRLLGVVRSSTVRMSDLIDDILAFSRMGRQEMATTTVDMARLAREVADELRAAAPARRIRFEIGALPPVVGDRAMLRQVLVNLLTNAVKFTAPRDEAVIEVGGAQESADTLHYYVRDNGAGFDMQYADKLFGVFQRLHGANEFEGTGIGLAIVKRVVERHGGQVWAEGRVGEGACFHFTLPRP